MARLGSGNVALQAKQAGIPGGASDIYSRLSGPGSSDQKPMMLAEWGVRGLDRDAWIRGMLSWIGARSQVKA